MGWPNITVFLSYYTVITALRSCYLGLTECWRLMRNISRLMASHCSLHTCWILAKSSMKRISPRVESTGVKADALYTTPQQVFKVHQALAPISPMFSIAAAFGNVHGVYKAGNVVLSPHLLKGHQDFAKQQLKCSEDKPLYLVMHGGSGSTAAEIGEAVSNGVVQMNIDTDTQWAYWDGLRNFYKKNEGFLQGQIGNPDGADKPNKKFYDPRVWIRAAEESMIKRAHESFQCLNGVNVCGDNWPKAS